MSSEKQKQPYEMLPQGDTSLWRFMSISKFLSLIHQGKLYFNRADCFEDKWEGTFNKESVLAQSSTLGIEYPEDLVKLACWIPTRYFVSCWHASPHESVALWSIYGSMGEGIAIQTDMDTLVSLFPSTTKKEGDNIISQDICAVQYIDYKTEHPYLNELCGPLCYKRKAYSFEQEVRIIRMELPTIQKEDKKSAILMTEPDDCTGKLLEVDLNRLIKAIYIAPSSPKYILDAITEVTKRFGIGAEPMQSDLDDIPEYSYKDLTNASTTTQ